ncbi:MAG TPA: ATP-binding protein [Gemmatimonadales bacterium]|nr:ATP-binding protein [Gemmatimonadales bacterium]
MTSAERTRAAFLEVSRRLSAARTTAEAARVIVGVAQELLGWDCCSFDLYFPETDRVQAVLSMDSVDGPPADVPHAYTATSPGPVTARVVREGGCLVPGPGHGGAGEGLIAFGSGRPSLSRMFVPVRHGERVTGVLSIQSYTADAYDEQDLATLQELADHCGGAIERLRIEHALRESEAQLARTEAFALVMTAHLSLDGHWLKVPPTLCRLLGLEEHRLLGTSIDELLHPEHAEMEGWEHLVRGEARTVDLETRWRRPDGKPLWMYLNASLVQDTAGEPLYLLLYLRDITERKSLEDQLRQAQKMEAVGQLAGGIAHDFNNLLTAILGSTELLLADTPPDDPRREDVQEISRSAHRAAALVRQLLAYSRKQVLQPRHVDLNAIVRDMGAMLRRVVGEPIELRLDLDPGLGHVTADPGQLEQVIANLGVNARDAMPRGGTLTITTSNVTGRGVKAPADEGLPAAGPLVSLAVTDTGIGMDDEVRGRLFEPFFTTKELGRGTGLGLATVYGIVRQSGGHIQVRSRPGEGSSFTVYLPRAEAPRPARGALAAAAPVSGGSETVLVAEDEEAVRHLVCRVLRAKGYRVLEARHAEAALELAAATAEPIDLLVSDLVMPGLGGRALADRLLNLRPALRVLFITGYAPEAVERQGRLPAGHGLLEKPFTADQLAHKVRETLTTR